ncbi:bifunctional DNA primase/polymerase [Gulosibacter sp. 10]|uniref:bifunctional DNA primase/polymerase n=1 Tax=Gulosibacter sp. 10 TaxID=1255570 RepID=UPI00097EB758|nr:bifunctional DNA primase/polymerase [Gulosibacter sp. 10]SJM69646.1 DNA primase/helicase, phage-associated [Gulosibacter sp. 10]
MWDEFTEDERRNTTGYGVNCGRAGLVVIDLDTKATGVNGFDSWAKLTEGNENPATLTVSTPNGGEHRYYRITDAQRGGYANIRNSVEKVLGTGIDVRAKGGQVVGPGSTVWRDKDDRSKGKGKYAIKHAAPIAELPDWLFTKLTAKPEPKPAAAPAHSGEELPYDFPSMKAKRVLDKAALKVMNAAPGSRNDTLYRQTYAAAAAGAPTHAVTAAMTRAGIACGLPMDEIERTVPRTVEEGAANYVPEYEPVNVTAETRSATATAAQKDGEGFTKNYFTEDNLAPLFADKLRSTTAYVTEWRAWAVYEPTTGAWRKESGETVSQWAKSYFKAVYDDAVDRGTAADEVATRRLHSVAVCKNIMGSAAEELAVSSLVFDANPDVMLAANGAIDLRTGELREAKPEDYFMRRTGVRYLPDAEHAGWTTILEAISADTREYVQTIVGQAFTGHQPTDASIYFFHGDGSNGKSSIIDTTRACAGDYATNPSANVLLRSSGANDHSLMVFKGLRLALFEELPDSKHLDAYIVKRLSGSQVLRAPHKYQAEEEFRVIATSLINTNHLPASPRWSTAPGDASRWSPCPTSS